MAEYYNEPWYHSSTNRIQSEEILLGNRNVGSFLVRESETLMDAYVLSLLCEDGVRHYRILPKKNKFTLQATAGVQQCFFESLNHLVKYYSVPGPEKGLPVNLQYPVEAKHLVSLDTEEDSDGEDVNEDVSSDDAVGLFFQQQLDAIKEIRIDESFHESVKHYVDNRLLADIQKLCFGATGPPYFEMLLVLASKELEGALEQYKRRLRFLQELFDVGPNTGFQKIADQSREEGDDKGNTRSEAGDIDGIVSLLGEAKSGLLATKRRAFKVLDEYSRQCDTNRDTSCSFEEETYALLDTSKLVAHRKETVRDKMSINKLFQIVTGPWKTKHCLTVDVKLGSIRIVKLSDDAVADGGLIIKHDQIIQLVKSKTCKNKVALSLENKTIKNYQFENFKSRELFCHLIQQMKNLHSNSAEKNQLSIFIGSWNMGDAPPPADIKTWYHCQGLGKPRDPSIKDIPHDLIAIGTQETSVSEKEWVSKLSTELNTALNCTYKLVAAYSLWSLRLVIFIKSELSNKINRVKQSSVKTGIGNKLGNKGAVAVSFNYDTTSFCFINCHLTSGFERLSRRNENFHDIVHGLKLGNDSHFDVTLKFNHCFWFGDLNYRINLEKGEILQRIAKEDLLPLLEKDQLKTEQEEGRAFFGYEESPLLFRPTYRYVRGETHLYSVSKVKRTGTRTNVPSWCDRVLWKSYPGIYIENTAYGCTENILTSDHFPVFATFDTGILLQAPLTSDEDNQPFSGEDLTISFAFIQAKVLTRCNTTFTLEIHSSCLGEILTSHPNSFLEWKSLGRDPLENDQLYSFPEWTQTDLPVVNPVLSYQGYLEDQHLLITVNGVDDHELYGACCISLKHMLDKSNTFSGILTHRGTKVGMLRGCAIPSIPSKSKTVYRNKEYDLISIADLDEEQDQESRSTTDTKSDTDQRESNNVFKEESSQFHTSNRLSVSAVELSQADAPALPPKKKSWYMNAQNDAPVFSWMTSTSALCRSYSMNVVSGQDIDAAKRNVDSIEFKSKSQENLLPLQRPPVPPMRQTPIKNPETVGEWLRLLGLEQYEDTLIEEGWDNIHFFDVMTMEDLQSAGIENEEHREIILKSAMSLSDKQKTEKSEEKRKTDTA